MVSLLPRPVVRSWWNLTGGGYTGRSKRLEE